jgi:hypothetical protein
MLLKVDRMCWSRSSDALTHLEITGPTKLKRSNRLQSTAVYAAANAPIECLQAVPPSRLCLLWAPIVGCTCW